MRWKKVLAWVIVVYIVLFAYVVYRILAIDIITLPMDVAVTPVIGINVDRDAVHFGGVVEGGRAMRSVTLYNNAQEPRYVRLFTTGELAAWVTMNQTSLKLNPSEQKNVTLTASIPPDAPERTYIGMLRILFMR